MIVKNTVKNFWIILWLFCILTSSFGNENPSKNPEPARVKNVIIMIGDGMGVAQVYAGLTANKGNLNLERCRHIGFSKTYSANNYITDSAAGGTAIACGIKTNNSMIGMDPDKKSVKSMLEYAAEYGMSTGIAVTCEVTHATPASFYAHQPQRDMEEKIAIDLLNSDITVCIGGGRNKLEKRSDKQNITEQMKSKGYQIAYSMDEVKKVESGKLLGLMAKNHLGSFPGRGNMLPDAVQTSINILKKNTKGFILMVEGSQIDFGGHTNNTNRITNEMLDFDSAIKVALDFAEQTPQTLVIITADHETGGMTITGGNFKKGDVKAKYTSKRHTGVMVPIFAFGTGAEEFTGIIENTDILPKVLSLCGIK
ncbi:MAG: alkaline phosphatase [Bacteroidales bacterium]|jgi:alkaline phosphatase|nr:alkaline phosphatase [Bacteroidales bacterium]